MSAFDTLAALPQFVSVDCPIPDRKELLDTISGSHVRTRGELPGLTVMSAGSISVLEGEPLEKYLRAQDLMATLLARRGK